MPQILRSFAKNFSPFSRPSVPAAYPTQIRNKFYSDFREFTAWNPWGPPTDHSYQNHKYIEMRDRFVKQYDYPAELQKMIDCGWKSGAAPTGPRTTTISIGSARGAAPAQPEPDNPLRKGFGVGKGSRVACDWDHVTKFEQVAAFTFRGDTRPPELVRAFGGFQPPCERTDDFYRTTIAKEFYYYMNRKEGLTLDQQGQDRFVGDMVRFIMYGGVDCRLFTEYHFWRAVLDMQRTHLQVMTRNSFMKAYISTTRDIKKALSASDGSLGGAEQVQTGKGWIYVVKVKSGFLLKKGVGGVNQEEAEIAHLGSISWKHVYGFMHTGSGEIYLRNQFDQEDSPAFNLVLRSLSNANAW